jgi:hypothetical protein
MDNNIHHLNNSFEELQKQSSKIKDNHIMFNNLSIDASNLQFNV